MAIEVHIPAILCRHTDGATTIEGWGETIDELFADLDSRHPGIRDGLVSEGGTLQRDLDIYLNDEDVRFLGGLDAKLADGDLVTIHSAAVGPQ